MNPINVKPACLLALAALFSIAPAAGAQDLVRAELSPLGTNPYQFELELFPADDEVEVIVDERLLYFEVDAPGRRRPHICRAAGAPRSTPRRRVNVAPTGTAPRRWSARIDFRMYCWGRALKAVEEGASARAFYGFRGRSTRRRLRRRWVVKRGDERKLRLELGPLTVTPSTPRGVTHVSGGTGSAGSNDLPLSIEMVPRSARRERNLTFKMRVRSSSGSQTVYLRDDQWSFEVVSPSGQATRCQLPRVVVNPVRDFFRRVTPSRSTSSLVYAPDVCEDVFREPGIYIVTPTLELRHSGAQYGLRALQGVVRGPAAFVRITRGER